LNNLKDYLKEDMSFDEIIAIIRNMRSDYEDRVDDYIINGAEISKQRRDISRKIRELTNEDRSSQPVTTAKK